MQTIVAFILFLFPSVVAFPIVRLIMGKRFTYGKKSRIGFSVILTNELHLEDNASIRSFNVIRAVSIKLGENSRINRFNIIKGRFKVVLKQKACINQSCKITSQLGNIRQTILEIGNYSIIGVGHILDLTHNIRIGDNSILAGARSQLWTHGFYHPTDRLDHWRIDGPIEIGTNVYISTGVTVCAATRIGDNITVGAAAVVAKSLDKPGLYVNQNLRYLDFVPQDNIDRFQEVGKNIYEKSVQ